MILSVITGYVFGRFVYKRSLAVTFGVLLGVLLGLIASYSFLPLLYPIFAGEAGLIVSPGFTSIGIMFLIPDFVVYTEAVYILTRSYFIDVVFAGTGVIFASLGTWFGLSHRVERSKVPFEQM
jgi:hypothetical protein